MKTSPVRRRIGISALFATLALLLSSCMRVDMNLTLHEDDTADGTIIMAISDEAAETLGMDPQEMWDQMGSEMESDMPEGATQEPYAEDGYTGTKMTYAGQPISEMSTGGAEELSITREGDEFVVSGTMDMTGEEFDPSTGDEQADEMTRQMMEGFEVRISVTFPGEVGETNGEVDGTTVTWSPVMGETNEISARGSAIEGGGAAAGDGTESDEGTDADSDTGGADDQSTTGSGGDASEDSGSGFPWWILLVIGGIVLLGVIGLVLWLVLRKKPDAQDGQAAYGQTPYPGQPGQQYPGQQQGGYPGQPGQQGGYPGQLGQQGGYPGQPGQQGGYPGQPGQPGPQQGGYPGQPPRPGAYPPAQPGQYPGQQGQNPGQQGQYPGQQGQYPGQQPRPGAYPPAQPGQQYPGAHPQVAPTAPLPPQQPTQPMPPVPPAQGPGQPPQAPGPDGQGTDGRDDGFDDATRLRPPPAE
ncbi:hypothetical protein IF650_02980 [Cellulosimicrobium terreum]|nr:hypothetical protein [Cellulosimicrobium terreum]